MKQTSVQLTWTAASDGGLQLQPYRIFTSAAGRKYDAGQDMATVALSHTMTGLMPGVAYRFKVQARNSQGYGAMSPESERVITLAGVPSAPNAPTVVGTPTSSQVSLAWSAPNANGAAIERYAVSYQIGGRNQ